MISGFRAIQAALERGIAVERISIERGEHRLLSLERFLKPFLLVTPALGEFHQKNKLFLEIISIETPSRRKQSEKKYRRFREPFGQRCNLEGRFEAEGCVIEVPSTRNAVELRRRPTVKHTVGYLRRRLISCLII